MKMANDTQAILSDIEFDNIISTIGIGFSEDRSLIYAFQDGNEAATLRAYKSEFDELNFWNDEGDVQYTLTNGQKDQLHKKLMEAYEYRIEMDSESLSQYHSDVDANLSMASGFHSL